MESALFSLSLSLSLLRITMKIQLPVSAIIFQTEITNQLLLMYCLRRLLHIE